MSVRNLMTHPTASPMVAASILGADFADMGAECRAVLAAGADLIHLDVMDGHFVPNLTMGPAMCGSIRRSLPEAFLDVHLMVTHPERFVMPFAAAGANHFTFHIEANADPLRLAGAVHEAGMTAGIAINPPTDVERVLPLLDAFDLVLVMSVNPGFAGQTFIADVLDKARSLAPRLSPQQRLQIDGGVTAETAASCREAGCDVLVAASAIFASSDYSQAVDAIRGSADTVTRRT